MRFQALALGAFVGLGLCTPNSASAQMAMPTVEPTRDWKVGVRADGYYDTNIARSSKGQATAQGLKRSDYVFTPAVTVALVQPFGRQSVFLNGEAGYTFYKNNSELNRRRAKMQGGVASILGPCRQVTFGGYDAAQSDLANLDATTTQNLRQTKSIALGLSCARPVGPGVQMMVQRADTKNSTDRIKESDATTETAMLGISYGRPSLGTISLGANYSSTEYPNRIIPGRPVGDGFFVQSYQLSYQRNFGSRLTMSAGGGVSHVKREFAPPGVDQSFNSATYSLDVVYGFGERIDLEVRAAQAVTPSQQVGKSYDKRTSADGTIRYKAGNRLSFAAGYSWQDINSNVDTASQLLVVTSAQVDAVFATADFKPNETMSLGLEVRHEQRDANLPQFNYTATRLGVRAQASF